MTTAASSGSNGQRLDKWLWRARFFKTRSLATKLCNGGHIRSGGNAISKAHHQVRVGDVLTFAQGRYIRVVKVLALGTRRGPATEARTLYEDLKPPETSQAMPSSLSSSNGRRPAGTGRPTKRERRRLDHLRSGSD
jgi:ribosome-associated heat shock protein Hsp15